MVVDRADGVFAADQRELDWGIGWVMELWQLLPSLENKKEEERSAKGAII